MLRLFKQNTIGQILVIVLTAIVLWARAFIEPVRPSASLFFSPIYELVYGLLCNVPRVASAIALLLVLMEGLWLNLILVNHKMTKAHSLMPLLLYVAVMSWDTSLLTVTPMLLVNIAILAACSQLLSDGSTTLGTERNFNAAFFIGLAALCCMPAAWYVLPYIFVFIVYKLYRWRNAVVSLLGLIAPFIVLFFYAFLSDKLDYYLILIWHDLKTLHLHIVDVAPWSVLPTAVLLLMIAASLLKQLGSIGDSMVHQRINTGIMSLPLLAAAMLAFYSHDTLFDIQALAIPFGFLGTRFFLAERRRQWTGEVMIWLFLLCALINCIL